LYYAGEGLLRSDKRFEMLSVGNRQRIVFVRIAKKVLLAVLFVPVCECLTIMLLHKKVFPASWRKKQSEYLWTGAEQEGPLTYSSDKTYNSRVVREAILYAMLLAITLYIGFHFSILRRMREDDMLLFDKIASELERMTVPLEGGIVISIDEHLDLEASLVVSCQAKVNPSGETPYCAIIRKHILIPWIQVDIEEIKVGDQVVEDQNSN
jgi:hypothetical protein